MGYIHTGVTITLSIGWFMLLLSLIQLKLKLYFTLNITRLVCCHCWQLTVCQLCQLCGLVETDFTPVQFLQHIISTSTQNASIWSPTAAAPSNGVFRVPCTNLLTYLLIKLGTWQLVVMLVMLIPVCHMWHLGRLWNSSFISHNMLPFSFEWECHVTIVSQ